MTDSRVIWTALPQGLDAEGHLRVTAMASIRLRGAGPLTLANFPWVRNWTSLVDQAKWHASFGDMSLELVREDAADIAGKAWWDQLFPDKTPVISHTFDDLTGASVVSYDPSALQDAMIGFYGQAAASVSSQALPSLGELGAAVSSTQDRRRLRDLWTQKHKPKPTPEDPPEKKDDRASGLEGLPYDGAVIQEAEPAPAAEIAPLVPFAGLKNFLADPKVKTAIKALDGYMAALTPPSGSPKLFKPDQSLAKLNQAQGYEAELAALQAAFDFHVKLSTLGQHSPLMRIVRLTVPLRSVFPINAKLAMAQTGGVRLICQWKDGVYSPDALPDGAPMTLLGPGLRAASKPGGYLTDGWLDPVKAKLDVIQMDVEGAIRKMQGLDATDAGVALSEVEAIDTLTALPSELASDQDAGVPALRSQGFALTFKALDQRLKAAFKDAKAFNDDLNDATVAKTDLTSGPEIPGFATPGSTPLYAEDLTRGFRIDVYDQDAPTPAWFSLHRRTERYAAGPMVHTATGVEGQVRGALAQAAKGDAVSPIMVAHPALAVWTGWSLSVPHPAKAIGNEIAGPAGPDGEPTPELLDPSNPDVGLGLSVNHTDAQGLPSLRYGRRYGFRVRAVDLAGQSLAPDVVAPGAPVIVAQRFDRLDPIEPPVIAFVDAPEDRPIAGEALHRLAIRSLAGEADGSGRTARRLAYPPRVAMDQAERHGKLDKNGRIDPDVYGLLAGKDHLKAAIPTQPIPLEPPTPGEPAPEAPEQRAAPIERLEPGYLPDPLARKWAVRIEPIRASGLSAQAFGPDTIVLAGEWPSFKGLVVTLKAGQAAFDLNAETLAVTLPPGDAVRVVVSIVPPQPKAFGVWNWAQKPQYGPLVAPTLAAETGQHWMISPARTLELIHAVQKPVLAPTFGLPTQPGAAAEPWPVVTSRAAGSMAVNLAFVSRVHLNSTRQVEVYADWEDPVDAIGPDVPLAAKRSAQSFVRPIQSADFLDPSGDPVAWIAGQPVSTCDVRVEETQTFADPQARLLALTIGAASRYREYMPKTVRDDTATGLDSATTLSDGKTVKAWVPSTARPPAPVIVSVTPTFAWDRKAEPGAVHQSSRRGRPGYRVWLDRPWSVTGFNEMLAVCLYRETVYDGASITMPVDPDVLNTKMSPADRKGIVTEWGLDPLFLSPDLAQMKGVHFPRAVNRTKVDVVRPAFFGTPEGKPWADAFDALPDGVLRTVVSAPGRAGRKLMIAPHLVDWDPERKLWFCDIEIEVEDVYMPFVQLALARYQPMSLYARPELAPLAEDGAIVDKIGVSPDDQTPAEDLHLSSPVVTDFLQVLPERLSRIDRGDGHVDVRVYGLPASVSRGMGGSIFQLRLVDISGPDPDLHPAGELVDVGEIPVFDVKTIGMPTVSSQPFNGVQAETGTWSLPGMNGPTPNPKPKTPPLLFSGRVKLPAGGPRRLVIEEFEGWPTAVFDAEQQFPPGLQDQGRLVYLDQFDL